MKKSLIFCAALLSAMTLSAQKYNMVVHTTDGNTTKIPVDQIESVSTQEQPSFTPADHIVYAMYSTSTDKATYRIDIATAPTDQNGLPSNNGDRLFTLAFTAPLSNGATAMIPVGNYGIGNGKDLFTWDVNKSSMIERTAPGNEGLNMSILAGGFIDVDYQDGEYDIRAELVTLGGEKVDISFEGPINFRIDPTNYETFKEDVNVNFEGAQGRYYANWNYHFADDVTMQLYTGTFEDGKQTEGYWMNLDLYIPKVANPTPEAYPSPKIADGVYTVDNRTRGSDILYAYHPFSFILGSIIDALGIVGHVGSYITYIGTDGKLQVAHLSGGTLTVADNGTTFNFDFETTEGIKVKGSYSGNPAIRNFCDNFDQEPERPYSTITGDHQLNFVDNTVAIAYNMGDNYLKPGITSYILMVTDPASEHGDFLTLDLFADGDKLPDGTYEINDKFNAFSGVRGYCDFGGNTIHSWYGDLDSTDADGYQTLIAPVNGGSLTITTVNGVSTITFNLTDDNGHSLKGSWSGNLIQASPDDVASKGIKSVLKTK